MQAGRRADGGQGKLDAWVGRRADGWAGHGADRWTGGRAGGLGKEPFHRGEGLEALPDTRIVVEHHRTSMSTELHVEGHILELPYLGWNRACD